VTTIPREAAAFSGSGKTAGKKKSKTKKPVKKKKK